MNYFVDSGQGFIISSDSLIALQVACNRQGLTKQFNDKYGAGVYTSQSKGTKILISEMATGHIRNALLKRLLDTEMRDLVEELYRRAMDNQ